MSARWWLSRRPLRPPRPRMQKCALLLIALAACQAANLAIPAKRHIETKAMPNVHSTRLDCPTKRTVSKTAITVTNLDRALRSINHSALGAHHSNTTSPRGEPATKTSATNTAYSELRKATWTPNTTRQTHSKRSDQNVSESTSELCSRPRLPAARLAPDFLDPR